MRSLRICTCLTHQPIPALPLWILRTSSSWVTVLEEVRHSTRVRSFRHTSEYETKSGLLCTFDMIGLTFATMLAIRDAGLPMPAGVIGWSPWIDLLLSMPSVQENTSTDYLPAEGFTHGGHSSMKKLAKVILAAVSTEEEKMPSGLPAIQHYTNNNLLHCKYVSPLLEDNLEGTCPILIVSSRTMWLIH